MSAGEEMGTAEDRTIDVPGLLAIVAKSDVKAIGDVLAEELPWLTLLPTEGQAECIGELGDLLADPGPRAVAEFAGALYSWRSTAEIYGDEELLRRLLGPFWPTETLDVPQPGR